MEDNCCVDELCQNDDTHFNYYINGAYYCNADPPYNQSLPLAAQPLTCPSDDHHLRLIKCSTNQTRYAMETYNKHSLQSFYQVWHIQCTVTVTLIGIALAQGVVRTHKKSEKFNAWLCYMLEFFVISLPVIVSVNIANSYIEFIVGFAFLTIVLIIWRTKCWRLASKRVFVFGSRPSIFTLMRSTINFLTALCILAIDFKSFPHNFRKTRRFGAGLMDVGIGLFIGSMGLVSSRLCRICDIRKIVFTVGCLFGLGLARTSVIAAIDYHQDEHEYGVHLNAFFTLAFTKLFATLIGFIVKSDKHLLPLGVVILVIHEVVLQCGIWKYVMDPGLPRTDFITANREGLCSLPGFISLYILSQYLGQWLKAKAVLSFEEIKEKLKILLLTSLGLWLLVTLCIFTIGIARVTCNLGYVAWISALALTMCTLYLFVFDIVLDTLQLDNLECTEIKISETVVDRPLVNLDSKLPLIIEAVNYNGLTFFLLANILTGCTNIFLKTEEKSDLESFIILLGYMLITTTFVFILYQYKLRIA